MSALIVGILSLGSGAAPDWRHIENGFEIPSQGYADQPYVVVLDDGTWVCTLTTGPGNEGDARQHVVSTRSTDQGRTWAGLIDIEPAGPPEASWVMPLLVPAGPGPAGRIYAFYVYNSANIREAKGSAGQAFKRVDTLGSYVFKYSDNGGLSWSRERFEVPIRPFKCDLENVYGGEVRFFWGVGKPIIHEGAAYIGMSKVGALGQGFLEQSEGFFLRSDNILGEPDPAQIQWETLPAGDVGLLAPKGPIAEEHNLVALSDGSLYCTYRTTEGHPCHAYSRDGGRTWNDRQYMTYAPGGRRVKHPRAANFVWKCGNGKYLYWFHNHGGQDYAGRNPAWLSGGVERDGHIHWAEPEIVLYTDDPGERMSYPCLIEDGGAYFITETQKTVARVHRLDTTLLEGLWTQHERAEAATDGLLLDLGAAECMPGAAYDLPPLPRLAGGGGLSVELWLDAPEGAGPQVLVDARDEAGKGFALMATESGAARIELNDGQRTAAWESDPGLLMAGEWHHVAAIVDGGPKIITFVVDGVLCDGGTERAQGWMRFDAALDDINGPGRLTLAPGLLGRLGGVRVYGRYLRTSEAVGNYRAGRH
ncbi:MAG: exo-alpha-sialidase [Candidatus Hydrogenedentes bacterium]|nr:exo-alpha-sialidase [Candidatus Hydrogenedentota bacterium]